MNITKLEKVTGTDKDWSWILHTTDEELFCCCGCKKDDSKLDEGFYCKPRNKVYCVDCEYNKKLCFLIEMNGHIHTRVFIETEEGV